MKKIICLALLTIVIIIMSAIPVSADFWSFNMSSDPEGPFLELPGKLLPIKSTELGVGSSGIPEVVTMDGEKVIKYPHISTEKSTNENYMRMYPLNMAQFVVKYDLYIETPTNVVSESGDPIALWFDTIKDIGNKWTFTYCVFSDGLIHSGGQGVTADTVGTFEFDKWHTIAVVTDITGDAYSVYVDGEPLIETEAGNFAAVSGIQYYNSGWINGSMFSSNAYMKNISFIPGTDPNATDPNETTTEEQQTTVEDTTTAEETPAVDTTADTTTAAGTPDAPQTTDANHGTESNTFDWIWIVVAIAVIAIVIVVVVIVKKKK